MARFDGTGPNGQGRMSGWGMGNCLNVVDQKNQQYFEKGSFGVGRVGGRGFGCKIGRGCGNRNQYFANNDLNSLNARAEYLKNELDNISKTIDSLKNK